MDCLKIDYSSDTKLPAVNDHASTLLSNHASTRLSTGLDSGTWITSFSAKEKDIVIGVLQRAGISSSNTQNCDVNVSEKAQPVRVYNMKGSFNNR